MTITEAFLKRIRRKLGATQEFMAVYLKLPYETYRSLETGRRTITDEVSHNICDRIERGNFTAEKETYIKRRAKERRALDRRRRAVA